MPELFFIILFSTWYFRTYCDEIILLIWHNLQQTWWFQLESFEPLLVIFSFTFFIGLFNFFDLIVRVHGMSDDLHEEKPSLLNYIGRWLNQYRVEPHILPSKCVTSKHFIRLSALKKVILYLTPIFTLDLIWPRRKLHLESPSFTSLIFQIFAALFIYDLLFTISHIWLHTSKYAFLKIHSRHHTHSRIQAMDTINLSFFEAASEVTFSIIALNVVGCHPLARALYDILIVFLLVELHSGYDFPFNLANLVPFNLISGPKQHYLHHRFGNVYFHKYFTCLDFLNLHLGK